MKILGSRSHLSSARLAHFPVLCDNYNMEVIVLLSIFLQAIPVTARPARHSLRRLGWNSIEMSYRTLATLLTITPYTTS
jgi:hypothetical protein